MNQPAIDPTTYAELQATAGADFVLELVDAFLDETPGMMSALRSARATADAAGFRRAAHSIKSNANTFGAHTLAAMAREFELRGLDADPPPDDAAIDALQAELDRATAALTGLRDG